MFACQCVQGGTSGGWEKAIPSRNEGTGLQWGRAWVARGSRESVREGEAVRNYLIRFKTVVAA
jgi:hypothetical protein